MAGLAGRRRLVRAHPHADVSWWTPTTGSSSPTRSMWPGWFGPPRGRTHRTTPATAGTTPVRWSSSSGSRRSPEPGFRRLGCARRAGNASGIGRASPASPPGAAWRCRRRWDRPGRAGRWIPPAAHAPAGSPRSGPGARRRASGPGAGPAGRLDHADDGRTRGRGARPDARRPLDAVAAPEPRRRRSGRTRAVRPDHVVAGTRGTGTWCSGAGALLLVAVGGCRPGAAVPLAGAPVSRWRARPSSAPPGPPA